MKVILQRLKTGKDGTFGFLTAEKFNCYTIEPPWKNNQINISCILAGKFSCSRKMSRRFGDVFQIEDVRGRSNILFHSGNYGGDEELNLKTDTHGCILLGSGIGEINNQQIVLNSRETIKAFFEFMGRTSFILEVRNWI